MLGKPENGWALFQMGSGETGYDVSYVTDVAMDWLSQAIHGLETEDVFSVHGYCEPGRVVCTVSFWNCYVIFEDDGRAPACHGVHHLHVSMLDFCRMLHRDISQNLDDWIHWDSDDPPPERANELKTRLNRLEQLIREKKEDFEEGCCFL